MLFCALILINGPGFALPVEEVAKLLPPVGNTGDLFGSSVAISGDTAIVGAQLVDIGAEVDAGAAYVFVETKGVWNYQATLTAPEQDANAGDRFGEWVAIDGETVVIGALDDQEIGFMAGAAYVFVRTGVSWNLEQKLLASDGAPGDRFGETVYIDGDTIGVGARFANQGIGSAYIFTRSGGAWTEEQILVSPAPEIGAWFGTQVAISGDTAIVGARHDDEPFRDEGAAYVFVRSGASWNHEATLLGESIFRSEFGTAVDIDGETLVVSATRDFENDPSAGAVFVYTRSNSIWSLQQKLMTIDDNPDLYFLGTQLALHGNTLVAGATRTNAAFLFERSGDVWAQEAKITTDDASADWFGLTVGLDGDHILIGARLSTDNGAQSGSAFVFEILPDDLMACLEHLTVTVMGLNIQQGIENALDAKLQAVLFAMDDAGIGDPVQVSNMLAAFNQNVDAQRGQHLTEEQADALLSLSSDCDELIGL